jgi:putative nucleotidyltransferase with HDIG domain
VAPITQDTLTPPKVCVVTKNEEHGKLYMGALRRQFDISLFADASQAGDEIAQARPDVILVETEITQGGRIGWLSPDWARFKGKTPSFVFIAKKGEGFGDLMPRFGKGGRYLTWPVSAKSVTDAILDLISGEAEKAWDDLPEKHKKPLKMTVAEYQSISDHIAKGEPIDCNAASDSCAPLAEAVKQGEHHSLLHMVQSHHNYTYVHSMRVATLLTLFGHAIGMKGDDLIILSAGGLLHDVGKMITPPKILDKPGKLSEDEWPIMKNHVIESITLLDRATDLTKGARIIAEQHHEKLDGSGYPLGLKSTELNELARMSVIADIFGALTDRRSYKPAFPSEKAFAILEDMNGAVDQNMLALFKDIFLSTQPEEMSAQLAG